LSTHCLLIVSRVVVLPVAILPIESAVVLPVGVVWSVFLLSVIVLPLTILSIIFLLVVLLPIIFLSAVVLPFVVLPTVVLSFIVLSTRLLPTDDLFVKFFSAELWLRLVVVLLVIVFLDIILLTVFFSVVIVLPLIVTLVKLLRLDHRIRRSSQPSCSLVHDQDRLRGFVLHGLPSGAGRTLRSRHIFS
jgi:hypothetical protein